MNLETLFTSEDVAEIYDDAVVYSILKYDTLSDIWKEFFERRYDAALKHLKNRNIDYMKIDKSTMEFLKDRLMNYQQLYNQILEQNQETIELVAPKIEKLIILTGNTMQSEIERVSFLFDFITSYITYSEDYFHYCLEVPPIDGFTFDFKNNLPVDSSIDGMLVIGQGLCDDISNLMIYLGKKLKLNIGKTFATYKGNHHSFNTITLQDGNTYLIDATRKIRKDMQTSECFLVSQEELNKNHDYIFEDKLLTSTYPKMVPRNPDCILELIERIKEITPSIIDLNNIEEDRTYYR